MIHVFNLSNASNASGVSLTANRFKREGESARYVCKITDATIVFVGDNAKLFTNKSAQINYIKIMIP